MGKIVKKDKKRKSAGKIGKKDKKPKEMVKTIKNKKSKFKNPLGGVTKTVKLVSRFENGTDKKFDKPKKISKNELDPEKLKKYNRGDGAAIDMIKVKYEQEKIAKREKKIQYGLEQSVKSEMLLTEESGYLEPEEDEVSTMFTQSEIKNSVDPLSASKRFDLDLRNFGPYRMNYTRNGRFLLLGGRKGHVAAMDWVKKKLLCEINVMESAYDVAWLHQETLFAVAQKKWVYFYDNQGVEIHCVKKLHDVMRMTFLPYHFLLATVSTNGFISWLDVSIGKMIEQFHLRNRGLPSTVTQHPGNAMICVGEPNGVVSFWGPNSKKPCITQWCHKAPICAVAFDPRGLNYTTASMDRTIKIWDARNLNEPLQHYLLRSSPNCISMSHKGILALGLGNVIEVYKDTIINGIAEKKVYLRHRVPRTIMNMEFCPFEDILGIAHSTGFSSMLVPGCGEPNYDALEINPYQTKSQRQEAEVKALLGKIPADLITWDTTELRKVDIPSFEEIVEAKKQLAHIKPPNVQFIPKKKKGKQAGSAKAAQRKKIMKEQFRRNYVKEMKSLANDTPKEETKQPKSTSVLDRFKIKPKNW